MKRKENNNGAVCAKFHEAPATTDAAEFWKSSLTSASTWISDPSLAFLASFLFLWCKSRIKKMIPALPEWIIGVEIICPADGIFSQRLETLRLLSDTGFHLSPRLFLYSFIYIYLFFAAITVLPSPSKITRRGCGVKYPTDRWIKADLVVNSGVQIFPCLPGIRWERSNLTNT